MLNKVILMGRLTAEPELRHTTNNTPVASFTLAVNRDRNRDETDFIEIVAWSKSAEFVSNWFHKGQLVAVTGRLQVRNWTDKEGNNRRTYEVVAEETHFAESRRDSSGGGGAPAPRNNAGGNGRGDFSAPAPTPVVPSDPSGFSDLSEDDDELPF